MQQGYAPEEWKGRPVIAILNTWSEAQPCHMHFKTRVLSAADFSNWVRAASKTRAILDDRSYEDLAKQSVVPPAVLQLADSDLFHSIVTQRLPPGPGPTVGRPTPAVSPRSGT